MASGPNWSAILFKAKKGNRLFIFFISFLNLLTEFSVSNFYVLSYDSLL
ncbi:hypothetical protein Llab_0760 [Lactococcus lactis]|nr:hypothetical protein Llab_0760 [Lactococcus lactis]